MIFRVDIKSMLGYGYERDLSLRCKLLGDQSKIVGTSIGFYSEKKLLWVLPLDLKTNKNPKSKIKWGLPLIQALLFLFSSSSCLAFLFALLFSSLCCIVSIIFAMLFFSLHCVVAILFMLLLSFSRC